VLGKGAQAGFDHALLGVDADSPTGAVSVYERVGFGTKHRAVTYATTLD
jgi:mycothiol synthase